MAEKLDLLLINPGAAHGIYGDLGKDLVAVEPPLWCRLIAGYIRDRGYSVKIIDAEARGMSPADVAAMVFRLKPRLTCLVAYGHQPSASTQQMVGAGAIAKSIKRLPGMWNPVIIVGGHVSALPAQTMAEESIDYVCVGEGPITIEGLLNPDEEDFGGIPGLVWRKLSDVIFNKPAPLIEDMSLLHGNTWDLLPMKLYRAHNWQCFGDLSKRQPYASIMTSLGCPYRCSFCCINSPFQTNRYRMRDPADVVLEIQTLYHAYGVRTFKIIDEMFVLNEKHYMTIAGLLADRDLSNDINIWAYARVDTVKPHTLALLRKAGVRWLALGIESGSKYVRDGAQKRLKNDDIESVVRDIQRADINVIGNYIFGLPDDDERSMQGTLDLAVSLRTEFANFYSAMAYPGSPLYREAVEKGWKLPESWRGYSQHNDDCRPLDTLHVDAATVLQFRDKAFTTYFTNPEYLAMVRDKFGAETVEHIAKMVQYKLPRKILEYA